MKVSEFYELTEKIAVLIDEHLKIKINDLSNINALVEKEVALDKENQKWQSKDMTYPHP